MDFDTLFLKRKSVRAYEDRPVPGDTKQKVIAAMIRAPTAGALMLYSMLDIEEQAIKEKLAETCDHQPFIARAPWVLVFLADYSRMMAYFEHHGVPKWCERTGRPAIKPRESDLLLACCDALIAAQTAAIAAESLGLGSCYIGDIMENWEIHRKLLALPKYTFPITMLCIGYPTQQQKDRPQPPRLSEQLIVMKNRYRPADPEELTSMYQGEGYSRFAPHGDAENAAQALYDRKFAASFSQEMRRSVAAMLKDWE